MVKKMSSTLIYADWEELKGSVENILNLWK